MTKAYSVVFAGVPGTSKTPVANYLSVKYGLPVLSTDQIRYEVREDMRIGTLIGNDRALTEYSKRLSERFTYLLNSGKPFIFDGSMDRHWGKRKDKIIDAGYDWFMIDMELSKSFLMELFHMTGRKEFVKNELDDYLKQHEAFLNKYEGDISIRITDELFQDRLEVSAKALNEFIDKSR